MSDQSRNAASVQRHEHPGGSWELATRAAVPAVRPLIPVYVGYSERTSLPLRRLEVPHPNVTVIINLGAPLAVHAPAIESRGPTFPSFAAGLFDTVVVTETADESSGIELNLTPLGMWQLAGVPMEELRNRVVRLEDLFGGWATCLERQLREAPSWDARFDLLDAVLSRRFRSRAGPPNAVTWGWEQVASGAMTVGEIGRTLQWSRRRLGVAFRTYLGLTPKALQRLVRFDRVVQQVRRPGVARWSVLAHRCGYADQAHLAREFREYSGLTLTEFRRRFDPDLPGLRED